MKGYDEKSADLWREEIPPHLFRLIRYTKEFLVT